MPQEPKYEAVAALQELLPELETACHDIRRSLNVVAENFHASKSSLEAMLKKGGAPSPAVIEFLLAAREVGNCIAPFVTSSAELEAATNEMVKGARLLLE